MAQPVVHFEIIGADPEGLRRFYGDLFGWAYDTSGRTASSISRPGEYGFIQPFPSGVAGGVGGGAGFRPQVVFYVGVPDVEAALRRAEELGGSRVLGPTGPDGGELVVGHFRDPEGNLIGVAGPAH